MKRTPLDKRILPDYTRGEEICNMVTHIVGGALAIVATVLALSNALGIILPWIRLSVIGNISQETTAASQEVSMGWE